MKEFKPVVKAELPAENTKLPEVVPSNALDTTPLDESTKDVLNSICKAKSVAELKDLTELFNANMHKKNAVRIAANSDLLDGLINEVRNRVTKRPGELSDDIIVKYIKTLQDNITAAQNSMEKLNEKPEITLSQQNKTEININVGSNLTEEQQAEALRVATEIFKLLEENPSEKNILDNLEDDVVDLDGVVDSEKEIVND